MILDDKIELEFLASILQGKNIVEMDVLKRVEPGYFSIPAFQWVVGILKDRNWKSIPKGYLDQELINVSEEQKRIQYKSQVSNLYNIELTFVEDASKKFREYISYCIMNAAMVASMEGYNRSGRVNFLLSDINEGLFVANEVLEDSILKVVDYATSYDDRQSERRRIRNNPDLNPRLLTGIPGIDEQFRIKAPMIVDFIAPFKRYKSIFLNAMGYAFLLQGFNVAHITYENTIELTSDRYDSMFSGLNYNRVSNLIIDQSEKDMMDRMFEWMRSWNNRLKIIKCIPKITTVQEVEDKLKRIADKEGFMPDVEVWDYLNLIFPSRGYKEERLEQGQVVWDLKNHADKFNTAIIEASQTNMEGVKSERIDSSHRGKSIDISQGINLSIAIDQTSKEKEDGIVVLSPLFSRESEITIPEVVLDMDLPRMQISRSLYTLWEHALRVNPYN